MSTSNSSKAKKGKKTMATPRKLDFSNRSQPIPSQNQQIPQSPYPNQQFLNPNLQYLNPNQHFSNQQFQYHAQQFLPQPQFLNQISNPQSQFLSQNAYSHQPINFPSTQSPSYTNMLTQPLPQNDDEDESPQNVPPMDDEADVVTKESRPYSHDEDICLARAYIPCSDNPRTGRDQSAIVWWNDIAKLYNEEAAENGLAKKEPRSLKNRFQRLQHEVKTYIEAEKFVYANYKSGWDLGLINEEIGKEFQRRNSKHHNLPFKCGHVLGLLRDTAKFNFVTTRDSIPRDVPQGMGSSPTTPNIGSNGSTEQSREYHSGDKRSRDTGEEEVSSPIKHPQRPLGNKAAKKGSKGKAKVGGGSEMSVDDVLTGEERKWMLQEELTQKRQAHAERMKLLQEVADSQALVAQNVARKLDMEEKKLQLRIEQIEAEKEMRRLKVQEDREMKILEKDLNSITCDEEREKVQKMQQRILAKWNL